MVFASCLAENLFLLKKRRMGDYEKLPVILLDVWGETCRNKLLKSQHCTN